MEIKLTSEESIEYFYNALCNVYGTGYWNGYGLEFSWDENDYKNAREKLNMKSLAVEDVLLQILKDGKYITVIDIEGEGQYSRDISLQNIIDRVSKTPLKTLCEMVVFETDDTNTADVILQTVFFEEVVFG